MEIAVHPRAARSATRLFCCAAALALAGCGHMPVTSMVRLARVDFQTSDPAQLRAAIKLPKSLKPLPRGVALRIAVKVGRSAEEAQDFVLHELPDVGELAGEADAASRIYAYRLDDADVARLNAFRAALLERKKAGDHGSLSISVRPQACSTEEIGSAAIIFTSYLRTSETGSYVTLARDVDLRTVVPDRVAAEIPRCAS